MQTTKVACPLCRGVFSIDERSPVGLAVRCKQCGAPFTVVTGDLQADCEPTASARPSAPQSAIAKEAKDAPWWIETTTNDAAATLTSPTQLPPKTPRPGILVASGPSSTCSKPPVHAQLANQTQHSSAPGLPGGANKYVLVGAVIGGLCVCLVATAGAAIYLFTLHADQSNAIKVARNNDAPPAKPAGNPGASEDAKKNGIDPPGGKLEGLKPKAPEPGQQPSPQPAPKEPEKGPGPKQSADNGVPPPAMNVKHGISPELQKQIDDAINKGAKYLIGDQSKDGTWFGRGHVLGTTTLPALTLLHCGVPNNDPHIVKAADYVRKHWQDNTATYELSLAILFLDKLGLKKDNVIIQAMALRLIAGQSLNGGWDYDCPILTNQQATQLMTMLNKSRPKPPPTAIGKGDKTTPPTGVDKGDKGGTATPLGKDAKDGQTPLPVPVQKGDPTAPPPIPVQKGEPPPTTRDTGKGGKLIALFPPEQQKKQGQKKNNVPKVNVIKDDNSNTQFAMLALWAAGRHDVPVETTLAKSELRFRTSQLPNGGWAYHFNNTQSTQSMTCVGLLGLALGKGASNPPALKNVKPGDAKSQSAKIGVLDDQVLRGLRALRLGAFGQPQSWPQGLSLYYVWSVERVGVLYDLSTINDRDWYRWGVDLLLPTQRQTGFWDTNSYHGANPVIDTCFALLFLKRVNFAQEITDSIFMAIPDASVINPKGQ